MDVPTAAKVREWTADNIGGGFDFALYGYPEPEAGQPDRLAAIVQRAVGWIEVMVARKLDSTLTDASLVPLAEDATLMRVQQMLVERGTTRTVRDALTKTRVSSFRAGDYSQTNRDVSLRRGARSMEVTTWGDLSEVLLALATPDRRAQLLAELNGVARPLAVTVNAPTSLPGTSYFDNSERRY